MNVKKYAHFSAISVLVLVAFLSGCRSLFVNPLPMDEELIAHFHAHRKEIEALIKAYYAAPEPQSGERRIGWIELPGVSETMRRAKIERVHRVMGYWPPDPYSKDANRILDEIDVRTPEGRYKKRQYQALRVDIDDDRYFQSVLRYPGDLFIWKALLYIPAVADTHGGKLWPRRASSRIAPLTAEQYERSAWRLQPSLNHYPTGWRKGECVFRQLEKHWFIVMCRAA